jgi:hypothetical protein
MDFETEDILLRDIRNLTTEEQESFRKWCNRSNWKLLKKYKRRHNAEEKNKEGQERENI